MPLFHVSENSQIAELEPRLSHLFPALGAVVWAIDEPHLVNYLVPRDCPRVTFCAMPTTVSSDRLRFCLNGERRAVVVEEKSLDAIARATIYVYELPAASFTLHDVSAGYWISRETIVPLSVTAVSNLPAEITNRGADFRSVDDLWHLRDEVVASTLDYSIIRMRVDRLRITVNEGRNTEISGGGKMDT